MKIKILKEAEETMPIGQMRGDPQETMPLPGRGDDETREDEKSSPEEMSTGQVQSILDKHKSRNYPIDVHLKAAGFENVSYIASGQFGAVYAADHPSGREMAVKAVDKVDKGYDRELNAYSTIGKARQESEIIAKHFPLIYTIDTDSHDRYAFIVMERLTDEGPYADIIKDNIFSGGEYLVRMQEETSWQEALGKIYLIELKHILTTTRQEIKLLILFLKEHLKTTEPNSKHGPLHGNHGDKLATPIDTLILQATYCLN